MSIGIVFWIIVLVGLLFGIYTNRAALPVWIGGNLVMWILIILLGWAVFGPAIHH